MEGLFTEIGKIDFKPLLNTFEDFVMSIISIGSSFAKFLQSDEFIRIKNIISNAAKGVVAGYAVGGPIGGGIGGIAGTLYGGLKDPDKYSPEQRALFSQLSNNSFLENNLIRFGIKSTSLFRDDEGKLRYSSVNNAPTTIKLSKDEYTQLIRD